MQCRINQGAVGAPAPGPSFPTGPIFISLKIRIKGTKYLVNDDIGKWPDCLLSSHQEYLIEIGSEPCQHWDEDFAKKQQQNNSNRLCSKSFYRLNVCTKERLPRSWLCYSPLNGSLYCFPCRLLSMRGNQNIFVQHPGFSDWKHGEHAISRHEQSAEHQKSVTGVLIRKQQKHRIDIQLEHQYNQERDYWIKVLDRVVATIKFLAERCLAIRGSNEDNIGSSSNGNFLGILELIARYDPFLAEHIRKNANQGRGHTSYLSSTTCEEIILIMGQQVFSKIMSEVRSSKFFSVSVDSTPDISHCDQLTCIICYVLPTGPVECFLRFINTEGNSHPGKYLAESLLTFLEENEIDVKNCRGQTYDNASNMSGIYNGMQAHFSQFCPLASFIPCTAHSLNLVGQCVVDSCLETVTFFLPYATAICFSLKINSSLGPTY